MRGNRYLETLKKRILLQDILTSGINIIIILLIINILTLNFGLFEQSFMFFLALSLIIGLILFNLPFKNIILVIRKKSNGHYNKIILGIILIFLSVIILIYAKIQILWLASIPIFTSGLDLTLQGVNKKRKELYILSVVSFIYALFFILLQKIPLLWNTIKWFSVIFSGIIGSFLNKPLSLGSSASGLWIVIPFLILIIVSYFISSTKKQLQIIKLALAKIELISIWIIYIIIISFVDFESKNDLINLHYLLFGFCLIPAFIYLGRLEFKKSTITIQKLKDIKIKKLIKSRTFWALLFLFLSIVTFTTFISANNTDSSEQKILFYGQNMLGNWDIPEYGKYGREASGMFGLLPIYLSASNYRNEIVVENITQFFNITQPIHKNITRYVNLTDYISIIESPKLTKDNLKDVDIFIIVSINKSFSKTEKNIIWEFVERGGSLLVMGDHTNVGGIQEPLNDLLAPVDIRFRFDSALPFDSTFKWLTCYQTFHHPITLKIKSLDELQISVGASLDITHSSFPVVIGRYALSDEGDRLNEEMAYLGDYEYNLGEQLGDLVLVAGSYYGQGKVLVFGDTSTFQNSAIAYSHQFLQGIFTWLNSEKTEFEELLQIGVSVVFLIISFLLYLSKKNTNITFFFFPLILCISLFISYSVNPYLIDDIKLNGNIVYIDTSHGERINLELFTDDSINGLILNLNRNDYYPLIMKDFSEVKISESKILFLIAPTKSLTESEVKFLKNYMFNGGIVVLASGYEDKDASLPLLKEFKLDIEGIPLGPVPYVEKNPEEFENEPRFVDSWPIIYNEPNFRSYYNFSWDINYHLMVFAEYGNGGLLLISDSKFLLDENIESIYDYWPGNIIFLKHIMDDFKTMEK